MRNKVSLGRRTSREFRPVWTRALQLGAPRRNLDHVHGIGFRSRLPVNPSQLMAPDPGARIRRHDTAGTALRGSHRRSGRDVRTISAQPILMRESRPPQDVLRTILPKSARPSVHHPKGGKRHPRGTRSRRPAGHRADTPVPRTTSARRRAVSPARPRANRRSSYPHRFLLLRIRIFGRIRCRWRRSSWGP